MAGKTAAQSRALSGEFVNVYQKGTLVGARVIKRVPLTLSQEKVAQGKWRQVAFEDGEPAGVQPFVTRQARARRRTSVNVMAASEATITAAESALNAEGELRVEQDVRAGRLHRIVEPEDPEVLAMEKVRTWGELRSVEPGLKPVIVKV